MNIPGKIKCVIAAHVILAPFRLFTYVPWAAQMKNDHSTVTLVADTHSMKPCYNSSNSLHKKLILETLLKRRDREQRLVFEDITAYNGNNHAVLRFASDQALCKSSTVQLCDGLTQQFAQAGYGASSVEYRFCREAGVVPSMSWLDLGLSLDYYSSSYAISMHDIWQEFDDVIQQVGSFNDTASLNKFYRKEVERYRSSEAILTAMKNFNAPIKNFLEQYQEVHKYYDFLRRLIYFDAHLLDALVLHKLYLACRDNIDCVVVIGAAHAYCIQKLARKKLAFSNRVSYGSPKRIGYPISTLDVSVNVACKNDQKMNREPDLVDQAHVLSDDEIVRMLS